MRAIRSLHVRLALVLSVIVGVLTIGLVWAAFWSADRYDAELRQVLNRDVAAHVVDHVQPFAGEAIDSDALTAIFMDVMIVNPALEVYLLDADGEILAFDAPAAKVVRQRVNLDPVRRFLAADTHRLIEGDDPRDRTRRKPFSAAPVLVDGHLRGYLYMIVGGEDFDSAAGLLRGSHVARVFLVAVVGLALSMTLVGMFAFTRLTRRLRRLRDVMADFREDRSPTTVQVETGGDDEIAELSRTYERLATRVVDCIQRLEGVDRERREFVADVSHDLRTPLASLDGYLEALQGTPDMDPAQRREFIANASRRARQLAGLVDQLFQLARLESGDVPLVCEPFHPGELAQDVLQSYRIEAGRKDLRLVCRMSRTLPVIRADIGLIERALDNLISNATRHSPRGGCVELSVRALGRGVELSVHDTGPGIADADRERVFERAFRRNGDRNGSGTGLGLAITRRIVELHGGEIVVESQQGGGATFRFALPVVSA